MYRGVKGTLYERRFIYNAGTALLLGWGWVGGSGGSGGRVGLGVGVGVGVGVDEHYA